MTRNTKLGGWWRMWIVISGLWAVYGLTAALASYPPDNTVTARVGSDYSFELEGTPFWSTEKEIIAALNRWRAERKAYARAVQGLQTGKLSKQEFERATKPLRFRPQAGWSTSDVPPEGEFELDGTPRTDFVRWLMQSAAVLFSMPFALLAAGLSFRWVRDGFARSKPANE